MPTQEHYVPCHPIIKWVGGKRQLLPELLARIPKDYGTYFEPFFGGGALFFALQPQSAIINDFNPQLVNLYRQIKNCPQAVTELLDAYQNTYNSLPTDDDKTDLFKDYRSTFNQAISDNELSLHSAALFIFLNKTCFNGLYRVNSKGQFNAPPNHKPHINLYDSENILNVSKCLARAKIFNTDFEEACNTISEGDFVFFDSPYYQTFDTYQPGGFNTQDHIRLANLYKTLSKKGVKCMLTNSNTEFIHKLYTDYKIDIIPVKRMINCDVSKRTGEEVIVVNYEI